ncbi:ABC transporter membrane-spanning permease - sugar transport [Oceanicola granulosus HTCC2516]|uniref:ABC transporter membrane-spanning permease-sugar transport n=1 Tax=Oceanicola granulosus (strain ATCC BAA-861 / DSM 15982 / KCTC 12143 / HTCC2516) TaxID=314256 RepID=Q2CF38_OCEGH|nr:sugar ABC transporter permease [Oceanicola granulosus]EAR51289.1 ABC transporter membrane-spanning permease - sugar transport [Oceanicola granulosus HTCC2516]
MSTTGSSAQAANAETDAAGPKGSAVVPVRARLGRLFAAPIMIWLALTIALPLGYCIWISLTNANTMGGTPRFVGLANYVTVLTDGTVGGPFLRSLAWAIGGAIIQTLLAAGAALLLNRRFAGQHIARTWIMASWVVPTIVTAFLWRWMLNADFGVVNHVLQSLGLIGRPIDFLGDPDFAFITVTLVNAWRWFPFMTLLILAALTRVAPEYYEAARVEGATSWQVFTRVTLPFIQPVLYVVGLLGTLWSINVFDIIWLTTKGGPLDMTETMPVAIYERAFQQFRLGEASAMSVSLALFLLVFAYCFIRFVPRGATEQEVI